MYAGHLGASIAATRLRSVIPIWLLLVAAQLPDWVDAALCVAGISRGPLGMLSHSLPSVFGAALVLGALYAVAARDVAGALVLAMVVLSHIAADYLTGMKPTWPGGPVIGLQIYNMPLIDMLVEMGAITAGWLVYRRGMPDAVRHSRATRHVLLALVGFQLAAGAYMLLNPLAQPKC